MTQLVAVKDRKRSLGVMARIPVEVLVVQLVVEQVMAKDSKQPLKALVVMVVEVLIGALARADKKGEEERSEQFCGSKAVLSIHGAAERRSCTHRPFRKNRNADTDRD